MDIDENCVEWLRQAVAKKAFGVQARVAFYESLGFKVYYSDGDPQLQSHFIYHEGRELDIFPLLPEELLLFLRKFLTEQYERCSISIQKTYLTGEKAECRCVVRVSDKPWGKMKSWTAIRQDNDYVVVVMTAFAKYLLAQVK